MDALISFLPPQLVGFALTLMISLLIGFEREENRPRIFFFGGVRTFPMIGLGGFLLVTAFPDSAVPFAVGLLVVGILLAISFHASVQNQDAGMTTELAALLTFTIGATAASGLYWISIACGVIAVMLLQARQVLHGLADTVPRHEVGTLVRFLLITAVILPVVPNHSFTRFEINPFKIWLVVVAVCGVSYLSYLLQLRWDRGRGVILAGVLGGAYSSTVTTVVLARQSKQGRLSHLAYSGAITAATGVMYVRLWILVMLFAPALAEQLTWIFWGAGAVGVLAGGLMSRIASRTAHVSEEVTESKPSRNPLEMTSAFSFAAIFVAVLTGTRLVVEAFGDAGILILALIMGAADVDPFILGLAQYVGHGLELHTAALAVVITAGANNLMKGAYACAFGTRRTGVLSLVMLLALALGTVGVFLLG